MCIYASLTYSCGLHIRTDDEHIKTHNLTPRFRLCKCDQESCTSSASCATDTHGLAIRSPADIVLSGGEGSGFCPHYGSLKCPRETSVYYQTASRGHAKLVDVGLDDPGRMVVAYDYYIEMWGKIHKKGPLTQAELQGQMDAQLLVLCDGTDNEDLVSKRESGPRPRMHWY